MSKVIILCGKIASGKTTYAQQLKETSKAMLLSCDELMLTLFDSCLGEKHDDVVDRCSRFFYHQAEQLNALGLDVILDFGYWTKEEREKVKAYFQSRGIPVELHYLTLPEEERIRRLWERNKRLEGSPERVYIIDEELREYLDSKFEEPDAQEVDRMVHM